MSRRPMAAGRLPCEADLSPKTSLSSNQASFQTRVGGRSTVNGEQSSVEPGARAYRAAAWGGAVIVLLGAGWFLLAHYVMGEPVGDATGETLGVMLALLLVASVIGAVRSGRGRPG